MRSEMGEQRGYYVFYEEEIVNNKNWFEEIC